MLFSDDGFDFLGSKSYRFLIFVPTVFHAIVYGVMYVLPFQIRGRAWGALFVAELKDVDLLFVGEVWLRRNQGRVHFIIVWINNIIWCL